MTDGVAFLLVLLVVVAIMAGLGAQVARYRGASRNGMLGASAAGACIGVVLCSTAGIVGAVALLVASVFLAIWLNLFLLVRRHKHGRS